jgi:hypothetical protein
MARIVVRPRSGDPALAWRVDCKAASRRCGRRRGHVEFENSGDGNESWRMTSVLRSYVSKRLGPIDEKTAANSDLISHHPISVAVLTNHK